MVVQGDALTLERLKELLRYDAQTGLFTWRKGRQGAKKSLVAGSAPNKNGYIQISVEYRIYYAHRLAWFYVTGEWPKDQIDHVNGDRADNRWCNLREANQSQQSANSRMQRRNTTGFKGVTWHAGARKFTGQITHQGQHYYLGLFDTAEEAAEARRLKAMELHGAFARN